MFETGFTKGPCSATICSATGLAVALSMFCLIKTFFVSFVLFVQHQAFV
jgi:hypothetical protein